jgi:ABC-2 type transport system ATP-binding protein
MEILSVEGLTKRYGRKEAVSNISFTAGKSELIGLLGSNGAGKSTTLRMIAGTLAPTSGCIRVEGHDIAEHGSQAKSCIGYLPEVPPLYNEMTVGEYLIFARELKKVSSRKDAWMENLVKELKIENHLEVLIRNLSKGYRQRVGIAAAMAGRPSLLLLDEPASGLDPRQIKELRSLLMRITEHASIIVSSHSIYEISAMCSRIIIMSSGRIVADGEPGELAQGTNLEDLFISLTNEEET